MAPGNLDPKSEVQTLVFNINPCAPDHSCGSTGWLSVDQVCASAFRICLAQLGPRGYIGIMEKQMETTVMGYIGFI